MKYPTQPALPSLRSPFSDSLLGVEVGANAEDAALKARYHFGRHWDVEASPGVGSSSLDVMFNIDIK